MKINLKFYACVLGKNPDPNKYADLLKKEIESLYPDAGLKIDFFPKDIKGVHSEIEINIENEEERNKHRDEAAVKGQLLTAEAVTLDEYWGIWQLPGKKG